MNTIIAFSNQKGGVGKTTNCAWFANYLTEVENLTITVLDFDFQKSLHNQRLKDISLFDNSPKYDVLDCELESGGKIIDNINQELENEIILIDLPGKLDVDVVSVLMKVDWLICPISYDELTLTSTGGLIKSLHLLKCKAKIIFLPNRIKQGVRYDTIEKANQVFETHGVIAPIVPNRVALERINTLTIDKDVLNAVNSAYIFMTNHMKLVLK